jgi:hypothetical protein
MMKRGRWMMLAVASLATAFLATAPAATAADMTWPIVNRSGFKIEVQFFSRSRNNVWPAWNRVWYAWPGQQITPTLRCRSGEYICYGAWPAGNFTSFWGVGRGGSQGCSSCCFTCQQGWVGGHTLN